MGSVSRYIEVVIVHHVVMLCGFQIFVTAKSLWLLLQVISLKDKENDKGQ